jgi:type IV secretory pathway TrbL component
VAQQDLDIYTNLAINVFKYVVPLVVQPLYLALLLRLGAGFQVLQAGVLAVTADKHIVVALLAGAAVA